MAVDGRLAPAVGTHVASLGALRAHLLPHRGTSLAALDGYRAVAAGGVVVYHLAQPAGWLRPQDGVGFVEALLNNLGNFGVAVFFLLSGFLLYRPFVSAALEGRRDPDPVRFLRHRLLRIYPAYWVALTAFVVLIGMRNPSGSKYATVYLLVQNYRPAHAQIGIHVAWTLVIEMSFYLVLPLLAAAIRHGIGRGARSPLAAVQAQLLGLLAMVVAAVTYRCTVGVQSDAFDTTHLLLPNFLDWFALGMLLSVAASWRDLGRRLPRLVEGLAANPAFCWFLAALCYVTLALLRVSSGTGAVGGARETAGDMVVRFALNGLAALLLLLPGVLGRRSDDWLHRWLSSPAALYLGTISYGIYLWHTIWIKVLAERIYGTPLPLAPTAGQNLALIGGVLAATLLCGTASYLLVERPALRWKDPRRRRGTGARGR